MEENGPWAHSRNEAGRRHGLREHLEGVAALAEHFAGEFGAGQLGYAAGIWHDLGKYHPDFQEYLLASEAGERRRGTGPDHKAAGALHSAARFPPLAFLIAGHHGGLRDRSALQERITRWQGEASTHDALALVPPVLLNTGVAPAPSNLVRDARTTEFFLRMLFSALVDADFLDTERHSMREKHAARERYANLDQLWSQFQRYHAGLPQRDDRVARVRTEVYAACVAAAELHPGFFRLTVPTGGGKTLSAMAFALQHARAHGMKRVIVAVPYTSITQQTASVYRTAFGSEAPVLEHHSAIQPVNIDDQTERGLWGRLASENWDAPVIVTTTVQLFESLFARSTSKCRKLHRLARSVIVLDEAQSLPTRLLDPILDGLRSLTAEYGASVVLCTATQPAFDTAPGFRGLSDVRDLAPNPPALFAALRRVTYELPGETEWSWGRAADEMRSNVQSLAITNTIADCLALYDALGDPDAFCLSTLLCGAHRSDVLAEIRARLAEGRPCRVVSTQVVEAGVDIDFPLVLRAAGPLDRIVQAAGRCNREGRWDTGRVVVFTPADGKLPPGEYAAATALSTGMLKTGDLHDPELYTQYFQRLFELSNLDAEHIQELRDTFRYETVAERFKMIPDDRTDVYVEYNDRAGELLAYLRNATDISRGLLRALSPYAVSVRTHLLEKEYTPRGFVDEIREGVLVWIGEYDGRRGLVAENRTLFV